MINTYMSITDFDVYQLLTGELLISDLDDVEAFLRDEFFKYGCFIGTNNKNPIFRILHSVTILHSTNGLRIPFYQNEYYEWQALKDLLFALKDCNIPLSIKLLLEHKHGVSHDIR